MGNMGQPTPASETSRDFGHGRCTFHWLGFPFEEKYAGEQGVSESQALESGMQEKREEFIERVAEVYVSG